MFNFEQAIKNWKQLLRKSPAFEEGQIQEMETHLRDRIEELTEQALSVEEAFTQAVEEFGEVDQVGNELYKTKTTNKVDATPPWKKQSCVPNMLPNYFKTAIRNLFRNKALSTINILGLSLGIAASVLILLWVYNELSYDTYHNQASQIYRITVNEQAMIPGPVAPALVRDLPEVEDAARITKYDDITVYVDRKNTFEETIFAADSTFFNLFSFQLISGNSQQALNNPQSVVLTKQAAQNYFGATDIIGRRLTLGSIQGVGPTEMTVSGVIENIPPNSHFHFDILIPLELTKKLPYHFLDNWNAISSYTYVLVNESASRANLDSKITELYNNNTGNKFDYTFRAQPLTDIHLHAGQLLHEIEPQGSIVYVMIFSAVALIIIIIALINFVNLVVVRSLRRAVEIGVRKSLGAHRRQLIYQFVGESFLSILISLVFGGLIIFFLYPFFENLTGQTLAFHWQDSGLILVLIFFVILIIGLLSAGYPAFYLSSFVAVKAFKGKVEMSANTFLRKGLMLFQFLISILLITSAVLVHKQLKFFLNKDLGFHKEQVMVIPLGFQSEQAGEYLEFKKSLSKYTDIKLVSAAAVVPGEQVPALKYRFEGDEQEVEQLPAWETYWVTEDYLQVLDINLLAGRYFSDEFSTDSAAFIINQKAVDTYLNTVGLEWKDPLGKNIDSYWPEEGGDVVSKSGPVIGVVENFHYKSLHSEIKPLIVQIEKPLISQMVLKVDTGNLDQTINEIDREWKNWADEEPFRYHFLDQSFDELYRSEEQLGDLFKWFSGLAIMIACLGLLGLSAFMVDQRSKEVAVRKILGASVPNIIILLTKDFLMLIAFAFLLSIPVSYIIMQQWLQNFAYQISIGAGAYLVSAIIVCSVALLTVSYQVWRASIQNPVNSLRRE